ncbi:MAG: hypothetical protein JST48_04095 [Bacteroidetes bacterium]|nr:hypothetical protein [Bacteroidota bacterium]
MRRFLLTFCALIGFGVGKSQSPSHQLTFYSITEQDGLSDNRVTCFLQDHNGVMWIGTQDGLNKFDGSVIKRFNNQKDDSASFVNNHITALGEDEQHHLWITTLGGLSEYDPNLKKFNNYQATSPYGNANLMWDIQIEGNNIWIATEVGALRFSIKEKKFYTFYNKSSVIPATQRNDNWLTHILVDHKKRIWLASHSGLWRLYANENKYEKITRAAKPQLVSALTEDHNGNVWFGLWGEGIYVLNTDKNTIQSLKTENTLATVAGFAESTDEKNNYTMWTSGLCAFNKNKTFTNYSPENTDIENNFSESRFYFSQDGLLWISTPQGVRILDPNRQPFVHHIISPHDITNQTVALLSKGNELYVGGMGSEFLKLYDSSFKLVRNYAPNPMNFAALNLVREAKDQLWICTEQGLFLMNETTGSMTRYQLTEKEINTPTRNFFTNMFIDSRGRHWVFPWRSGIWQLEVANGSFKKIIVSLDNKKEISKKLVVATAVEDEEGNIWFGDLDEGLMLWESSSGKFSRPTEKIFKSFYSLGNIVYEKPYLWFVISGQVVRVTTATKKIDYWSIPKEFNKTVFNFCSDKKRLWITTSHGLLSFNKTTHVFHRFTNNDGLLHNEMSGVIKALPNGKILYAAQNYITEFRGDKVLKPTGTPQVTITETFSQNELISWQLTEKQEKKITLDHTHNNFTFHWALLNFRNPMQNQYYCKLEGIDKEWKYVGTTGQAEYASLAPGTYFFHARGATSEGIRNQKDDLLIITILSPFWQTWWFIAASIVLVAAVIYFVYRYRLKQILMQEKIRSKISTDLHDDIGSTLSSISILGDLVLQKSKNEISPMVQEIRDNALTLMEKMDDIVWGIQPDNDSLEKLLTRIKRFASQLFEARNIEYTIEVQENIKKIKLPMEHRQHIYLILKETINNVVKHAQCSKASILVNLNRYNLMVTVSDNGKGYDPAYEFTGNGIKSIRKRALSINADLQLTSISLQGSRMVLTLKIK